MDDFVNNFQDSDNANSGFDKAIYHSRYSRWDFDNVVQYVL